jgi:hypothetical protein
MSAGRDRSIAVSSKRKSEIFFEGGLDTTGKSVIQPRHSGSRGTRLSGIHFSTSR